MQLFEVSGVVRPL